MKVIAVTLANFIVAALSLYFVFIPQIFSNDQANAAQSCNSSPSNDCVINGVKGNEGIRGYHGGDGGVGGEGGWAFNKCAGSLTVYSTHGFKGARGQWAYKEKWVESPTPGVSTPNNNRVGPDGKYGHYEFDGLIPETGDPNDTNRIAGMGEYGGYRGDNVLSGCGYGGNGGAGGNAGQVGQRGKSGNNYGGGGGGGGGGGANAYQAPTSPAVADATTTLANNLTLNSLVARSGDGNHGGEGGDGGRGGQGGVSGADLEAIRDISNRDYTIDNCRKAVFQWHVGNDLLSSTHGCLAEEETNDPTWVWMQSHWKTKYPQGGDNTYYEMEKPIGFGAGGGLHTFSGGTGGGGGGGGGGAGGKGGSASNGQNIIYNINGKKVTANLIDLKSANDGDNYNVKKGQGAQYSAGRGGDGGGGGANGNIDTAGSYGNDGKAGVDGAPGEPGDASKGGTLIFSGGEVETCEFRATKLMSEIKVNLTKLSPKSDCQSGLTISSTGITNQNNFIIQTLDATKEITINNSLGNLLVNNLYINLNSSIPVPVILDYNKIKIVNRYITDMQVRGDIPSAYNPQTNNLLDPNNIDKIRISAPRNFTPKQGTKVYLTETNNNYEYQYILTGNEVVAREGDRYYIEIPVTSFVVKPGSVQTPAIYSTMPYLNYDSRYVVGVESIFTVLENENVYQRPSKANLSLFEFRTKKATVSGIEITPKKLPSTASGVQVWVGATQRFTARINAANGVNRDITWDLYGQEAQNTKLENCGTSPSRTSDGRWEVTCDVTIDVLEQSQNLFIKATSQADDTKFDFAMIEVLGAVETKVQIIDPSSKTVRNQNPATSQNPGTGTNDFQPIKLLVQQRNATPGFDPTQTSYKISDLLNVSFTSDLGGAAGVAITNLNTAGTCTHDVSTVDYYCEALFSYAAPSGNKPSAVVIKFSSIFDTTKSDSFSYILQANPTGGTFKISPETPTVDLNIETVPPGSPAKVDFKAINTNATCASISWSIVGADHPDTKYVVQSGQQPTTTWNNPITLQISKNETSSNVQVKATCEDNGADKGKFVITTVFVKTANATLQINQKLVQFQYPTDYNSHAKDSVHTSASALTCNSTPSTTCFKNNDDNIDISIHPTANYKPGVQTGIKWKILGANSSKTSFVKNLTGDGTNPVNEEAHLVVGGDETAQTLFIIASLDVDSSKTDFAVVSLSDQLTPKMGVESSGQIVPMGAVSVDLSSGFVSQAQGEAECTKDGASYKKVPYTAHIQFPYGASAADRRVVANLRGGGNNTYANVVGVPGVDSSKPGYTHSITGVMCISEFETSTQLVLMLSLNQYPQIQAFVNVQLENKTSNSIRIDCLSGSGAQSDCDVQDVQNASERTKNFKATLSLPGQNADYYVDWTVLGGVPGTTITKTSADTDVMSLAQLTVSPDEIAKAIYIKATSRETGISDIWTVYITNSKTAGIKIVGANGSSSPTAAIPISNQAEYFASVNVNSNKSKEVEWEVIGNITDTRVFKLPDETATNNPSAAVAVGSSETAQTIWLVAKLKADPQIMDILPISIVGQPQNSMMYLTPDAAQIDLGGTDFRQCSSASPPITCNTTIDLTAMFNLPDRFYCHESTTQCDNDNKQTNDVEWQKIGGVENTPIYNGYQIPKTALENSRWDSNNNPMVTLRISPAETANIIWVVAKSKKLPGLLAVAKITIVGKWTTGVVIEPGGTFPNNPCVDINGTDSGNHCYQSEIQFSAITSVPQGASSNVLWEVIGGSEAAQTNCNSVDSSDPSYDPALPDCDMTTIDQNGKLHISSAGTANFVYVIARLEYNPMLYDRVRIDIYGQYNQGVWIQPSKRWDLCLDKNSFSCVGEGGTMQSPTPESRCGEFENRDVSQGGPCKYGEYTDQVVGQDDDGNDITQEVAAFEYDIQAELSVPQGETNREIVWSVYGTVSGTTVHALSSNDPKYSANGGDYNVPQANGTFTRYAHISISPNETAAIITVVGRAVYDPAIQDVLTIKTYGRTTTGISISPKLINAKVGERQQFDPVVSVPNGESEKIDWQITGGNDITHITEDGLLVVSPFETSAVITVTASLDYDKTKFDRATVVILGRKTSGVLISPREPVFEVASTNKMQARVTLPEHLDSQINQSTLGEETPTLLDRYPECVYDKIASGTAESFCYNNDVIWSVFGGVNGTEINESTGELTISEFETSATLVVLAVAKDDESLMDAVVVRVTGRTGNSIRINERDEEASVGTNQTYTANVTLPKDLDDTLIWEVFGNSSTRTVFNGSVLTIGSDEQSNQLAIKAKLAEEESQYDITSLFINNQLQPNLLINEKEQGVKVGEQIAYTVNSTIPNGLNSAVKWSITGSTSEQTKIEDGVLKVDKAEKANVVAIKACFEEYEAVCDSAVAFIDHSGSFGYLTSTESLVSKTVSKFEGSTFNAEVWPIYTRHSKQVISFPIENDPRTVESIYIDGKLLNDVSFTTSAVPTFASKRSDNSIVGSMMFSAVIALAHAEENSEQSEDSERTEENASENANPNTPEGAKLQKENEAKNLNQNVIILNPEFLETLKNGPHTIEVKYRNLPTQKESSGFRVVETDFGISTASSTIAYLVLLIILLVLLEIYFVHTRFGVGSKLELVQNFKQKYFELIGGDE